MKIGVFICHCGSNIAGTVDCVKVAKNAEAFPDVAYSTDNMYMCSEPGQDHIVEMVKKHDLDGVVVASCSPRMHEPTFRRAVERAGLNKYMFEMANIREHVSWIGKDKEANTNKASELVRMAVEKLRRNAPLFSKKFETIKKVLVVGAGVAGIQAALDCADAGLKVVLVEREPAIGGKMAKLDKTFPTVDCSSCILGPKMVDVSQHPNITLYTLSEVEKVSGYVGNFSVNIKRRAPYVDFSKCTGCGACMEKCPAKKTPDRFNEFMGPTTAINIPFPQAIPKKATINPQYCRKLTEGKCGVCAKICPTGAINYEMKDEVITEEVGAIVAATGYDLMDWKSNYGEYGGGRYPDVITSLQYERLLSAAGPTGGHILRPSDGREPKKVAFICCVGSRDRSIGRPYCSGFCCMYTAKQAVLTKDHIPDSQSYVSTWTSAPRASCMMSLPAAPLRNTARNTSAAACPPSSRTARDSTLCAPPTHSSASPWKWPLTWWSSPLALKARRAPASSPKPCTSPTTTSASSWNPTSSCVLWKPTPRACSLPAPARARKTFRLPWLRAAAPPPRLSACSPSRSLKATRRFPT